MSNNELSPAYEDYIESIYKMSLNGSNEVRSIDVANDLGFSKASVSRAVRNLREEGYIEQESYGSITLTEKGAEYGKRILSRHITLRTFLTDILGVEEVQANKEACLMEHAISQDTMDKWIAWMDSSKH